MARSPKSKLPPSLLAVSKIDPGDPHQAHVGNMAAVRAKLLDLIDADDAALDAWGAREGTWDEAAARTETAMVALTRALLGQDPAVEHLPGWNVPGAIDVHLRRVLSLPEGSPEDANKTALAKLLGVTRRIREDTGRGDMDAETGCTVMLHFIALTAAHLVGERPPSA